MLEVSDEEWSGACPLPVKKGAPVVGRGPGRKRNELGWPLVKDMVAGQEVRGGGRE